MGHRRRKVQQAPRTKVKDVQQAQTKEVNALQVQTRKDSLQVKPSAIHDQHQDWVDAATVQDLEIDSQEAILLS